MLISTFRPNLKYLVDFCALLNEQFQYEMAGTNIGLGGTKLEKFNHSSIPFLKINSDFSDR